MRVEVITKQVVNFFFQERPNNPAQIGPGENDTVKVLEALGSALTHTEMLNVLSVVHGPWSFVFWQVMFQFVSHDNTNINGTHVRIIHVLIGMS